MVVSKQLLRSINTEAKEARLRSRERETAKRNADLDSYLAELTGLLANALDNRRHFNFSSLRVTPKVQQFVPAKLTTAEPAPDRDAFLPPAPTGFGAHFPGARKRYDTELASGEELYRAALESWTKGEDIRRAALEAANADHDAERAAATASAKAHNAAIDDLEQQCRAGDARAVAGYFSQVLEASHYPKTFPHEARVAYTPPSRQLVVELELPEMKVVPEVKEYRYVKARDEITGAPLPAAARKSLYTSIIAQLALRTINEVFRADVASTTDTVVLNGRVHAIDQRTGKRIHPCLVTVRTTRDQFLELDLHNVEPTACLKGLTASLSRSPSELTPVRPVLEFDMVDPRFVQEADVLSTLDTRPNLMELSPKEFESLITNLFEKMGLETRQTQASRDGGVDCVAYDPRPIFGGKVVIQAKRYKNTVGVSAVRDLFGTMQNEGASKGILVTTSGYGQASHDFANGKPLELLDGGNLLYLLHENAGIDAKIEAPADWVDPSANGELPDRGSSV